MILGWVDQWGVGRGVGVEYKLYGIFKELTEIIFLKRNITLGWENDSLSKMHTIQLWGFYLNTKKPHKMSCRYVHP